MRLFSFMKRKCLNPKHIGSKSPVLLLCFNPLKVFEVPEHGENPERDKEIEESYKNRESLTVEQRLELMFRKNAYGQFSPELADVQNATMMATLFGLMFGFSNRSFEVFNDFVVNNKHEMFKSPKAAQDILRRDMTKHGFNRGLIVGAKLGAVVFIYTLSTQTMNTVRNYVNPLDHAACGFTLGCLYRLADKF